MKLIRKDCEAALRPLGLLDIPSTAAFLSCSERFVRRLAAEGQLPGRVKLGRLTRYRLGALERWLENGCPQEVSR